MRRADRLFWIVTILRRGRVTTAAELAAEIEVSERTVYRDVADLIASGVPIEGEAGVGYALPAAFDLPPLMFDATEIAALVTGARIVSSWADDELAQAAKRALAKVENVLPERLRARLATTLVFAPDFHVPREAHAPLAAARAALDERRVLAFAYRDERGERTERAVHPLGLFFWGRTWTLAAWCTSRAAFRSFRIDRIESPRVLDERFEPAPGRTLEEFVRAASASSEPLASGPRSSASRPGESSAHAPRGDAAPAPRPRKTPKLDWTEDERAALRAARLRAADLVAADPRDVARRAGGVALARAEELVALATFQQLGSVGFETARDLVRLGFRRVDDLRDQDPVALYRKLQVLTRSAQDPCVEDVFRCVIAQSVEPDLRPEWRDWWHWTPLRGRDASARPSPKGSGARRRPGG